MILYRDVKYFKDRKKNDISKERDHSVRFSNSKNMFLRKKPQGYSNVEMKSVP